MTHFSKRLNSHLLLIIFVRLGLFSYNYQHECVIAIIIIVNMLVNGLHWKHDHSFCSVHLVNVSPVFVLILGLHQLLKRMHGSLATKRSTTVCTARAALSAVWLRAGNRQLISQSLTDENGCLQLKKGNYYYSECHVIHLCAILFVYTLLSPSAVYSCKIIFNSFSS